MSADNWSVCPRCLDEAKTEYAIKVVIVNEKYGKIPAEEWQADLAEATKGGRPDVDSVDRNFREDYGWWIVDGVLYGGFKGQCSKCQLNVKHEIAPVRFYDSPRKEQ